MGVIWVFWVLIALALLAMYIFASFFPPLDRVNAENLPRPLEAIETISIQTECQFTCYSTHPNSVQMRPIPKRTIRTPDIMITTTPRAQNPIFRLDPANLNSLHHPLIFSPITNDKAPTDDTLEIETDGTAY